MRIWKMPLAVIDRQTALLPRGATLLDVQMQHGTPCLWYLCDENAPIISRAILIYGTGNVVPYDPGIYIATFQMESCVWHVFEAFI